MQSRINFSERCASEPPHIHPRPSCNFLQLAMRVSGLLIAATALLMGSASAFQSAMPQAEGIARESRTILAAHHVNNKGAKKARKNRPKKVRKSISKDTDPARFILSKEPYNLLENHMKEIDGGRSDGGIRHVRRDPPF